MDPKILAKKQALMGMSSKLKEDARKPMGEELAAKKKMKVVIEAPDEKSLVKGLSKAEQLLKAKFGEMGLSEEAMEDMDEMSEDGMCPVCGDSTEDMHTHEDSEEGLELPEEEEAEVLEVE